MAAGVAGSETPRPLTVLTTADGVTLSALAYGSRAEPVPPSCSGTASPDRSATPRWSGSPRSSSRVRASAVYTADFRGHGASGGDLDARRA